MPTFTQKFPFDRRSVAAVLQELPETPELLTERYYTDLEKAHPLGIGWNKVESVRGWMRAAGLIQPGVNAASGRSKSAWELAPLGQLISAADPDIVRLTTVWVIHIQLAMNPDATAYYALFAYCTMPNFDRAECLQILREHSAGLAVGSINSELDGILPSFDAGTKLGSLGVLNRRTEQLIRGPGQGITLGVLGYALTKLRERDYAGVATASLGALIERPGALASVLGIESNSVRAGLRAFNDCFASSGFRFSETAGLDSVGFGNLESSAILHRLFGGELRELVDE